MHKNPLEVRFMPNIINQIIEIDSIAQKKLDEADRLKLQLEEETRNKIEETNALIRQKAAEKIDSIRSEEERRAASQMEEIQKEQEAAISRLEKIYHEKHEQLEQDIFNNVLGSSL